jgi:hypothetical protein
LPYIVGWIINYGILSLWMLGFRSKALIYLLLILLSLVSFFRGSGTDTAAYEDISENLLVGESLGIAGIEPGFVLLLKIVTAITNSDVLSIRLIALAFLCAMLIFIKRANRNEIFFALAFFIPTFFYPYSMNVIRLGLAAVFFLLGFQDLRKGRKIGFWLYSALAFSFHYSIIVVVFILMMFEVKFARPQFFLLVLLLFSVPVMLNYEYFLGKLNLYSVSEAPSLLSGLSKSAVSFALIILTLVTKIPLQSKIKLIFVYGSLILFFQALTLVSYAGIRLLDLATFTYPLVLLRMYNQSKTPPDRMFLVALCIAGLIGALGNYRNFLLDVDGQLTGTPTPFMPYKTIFDEVW